MTTKKLFLTNAAGFARALGTVYFTANNPQKGSYFRTAASLEKKDLNKRK